MAASYIMPSTCTKTAKCKSTAIFPDMLPIEHIWDVLGRRVRNRSQLCNNTQQLGQVGRALQEKRQWIPKEIIYHIITSMPRGCCAWKELSHCRQTGYSDVIAFSLAD